MKYKYKVIPIDNFAVVTDGIAGNKDIYLKEGKIVTTPTDNHGMCSCEKIVATIGKDMRDLDIPMLLLGEWIKLSDRAPIKDGVYKVRRKYSTDIIDGGYYTSLGFTNYQGYAVQEWLELSNGEDETVIWGKAVAASDGECRTDYHSHDCGCGAWVEGYKANEKKWSDEEALEMMVEVIYRWNRAPNQGSGEVAAELLKSLQKKTYPDSVELQTVITGQCDCPCHNPEINMMHIRACCNPSQILKINSDLTITPLNLNYE